MSALPCPFCGSDKITVEWELCEKLSESDTTRRWFAECTQCSCQGPFCQKEPQVIPSWNKRTIESQKREIEDLRKDRARLDWVIDWLSFNEDVSKMPCRDWSDNQDARLSIDAARKKQPK